MLRLVPFLAFAYVVAGLVAATSEAPVVFGRYSYQAAALIGICLATYLTAAVAWRRRLASGGLAADAGWLETVSLVGLVALTVVVTGSNAVQRLPWVQYVLPAVRVLAAAALIAREAARGRGAGAPNGPVLAAAMVLLVWASGDVILAAVTRHAPPHAQASSLAFREPVDVRALAEDSIVLIGDSFVWGQGVEAGETFGAQLEQRLRPHGAPDVHSLGVVGAGLRTYLEILSSLPPNRSVDRIGLVFYMNDMPAAPSLTDALRSQMITLGVGSPTLRIAGDLAARRLTPTLADYHAQVARDYDPASPTFAGRWEALGGQLAAFFDGARARSRGTPLLVVLPLMVDFAAYPLTGAHERLGGLGRSVGYEVVDLLPVFRDELGDGRRHLVSPEDNHFDAATHAVVARALEQALVSP